MTKSNRAPIKYQPLLWMTAGAVISLIIVGMAAVWLLPRLTTEQEAIVSPAPSWTPAGIAAATAIPTFTPSTTHTPSPTLTPSLTPTSSHTPTPTPTETPTVTPSATPTRPPMVRANQDTRLYLGPAADYPEQGWLVEGDQALITSQLEDGGWWYVETERGIRGWVAAGEVTAENDLSTVPLVTPLPRGAPALPPTPTPALIIGPLELDEVWPTEIIQCVGIFEFDVWMRAHGGTGVYTYLVNGEIVAEGVVDGGATVRLIGLDGAWLGTLSVVSGDLRVDREMYFGAADWCDDQ